MAGYTFQNLILYQVRAHIFRPGGTLELMPVIFDCSGILQTYTIHPSRKEALDQVLGLCMKPAMKLSRNAMTKNSNEFTVSRPDFATAKQQYRLRVNAAFSNENCCYERGLFILA